MTRPQKSYRTAKKAIKGLNAEMRLRKNVRTKTLRASIDQLQVATAADRGDYGRAVSNLQAVIRSDQKILKDLKKLRAAN